MHLHAVHFRIGKLKEWFYEHKSAWTSLGKVNNLEWAKITMHSNVKGLVFEFLYQMQLT